MPVYRDKARGRFVFEFDRRVGRQRIRAQKVLPAAWNQAQADAFDRKESARLYARINGLGSDDHYIEDAVAHYIDNQWFGSSDAGKINAERWAIATRAELHGEFAFDARQ